MMWGKHTGSTRRAQKYIKLKLDPKPEMCIWILSVHVWFISEANKEGAGNSHNIFNARTSSDLKQKNNFQEEKNDERK